MLKFKCKEYKTVFNAYKLTYVPKKYTVYMNSKGDNFYKGLQRLCRHPRNTA